MIVDIIMKMKSCGSRVGPHSNVTDVVIKKGTLDTDMCIGRGPVEGEGRGQDDAFQAKECHRLPANH